MFSTALNHLSLPLSLSLSLPLRHLPFPPFPCCISARRAWIRADTGYFPRRGRAVPFYFVASRREAEVKIAVLLIPRSGSSERNRCQPPGRPSVFFGGPCHSAPPLPLPTPSCTRSIYTGVHTRSTCRRTCANGQGAAAGRRVRTLEREKTDRETNIYIYIYVRTRNTLVG